jgi:glycosyltransferase involved in cell wall biosynthesis
MQRRPKVLVIADSASPELSSASLIGWSLSRALREHVDAHLVTHVRNHEALQRAGWSQGQEYTAIDPGVVENPINRFGEAVRKLARLGWTWSTALATFTYYYFEHQVWQRFGESIRAGHFDIVHRITPLSPATPSPIVRHCRSAGVPFVWGPMNGGVPWPREFRDALRREGEWLSYLRGLHRLMPGYGVTRRAAAAVITGSLCAWEEMRGHHERCVYIPENAIDPSRFDVPAPPSREGPLRAAFVGRLVPLKGVDMLIDAAAPLVRSGQLAIDIIGDGPEMGPLGRRVAEAKIAQGVALHGWIDHREVGKLLARSQIFAFPSIREFGGGVVLEAMALGLVPIVVNHGGPGELVTDETGFRVPLGSRDSIVAAFRDILAALAAAPDRARLMGEKARRRVGKLFTWDVKARQIVEIYRWVLGQRDKPDFGMPLPDDPA